MLSRILAGVKAHIELCEELGEWNQLSDEALSCLRKRTVANPIAFAVMYLRRAGGLIVISPRLNGQLTLALTTKTLASSPSTGEE